MFCDRPSGSTERNERRHMMTREHMDTAIAVEDAVLEAAVGGAKKISSSVGKGGKNKPANRIDLTDESLDLVDGGARDGIRDYYLDDPEQFKQA